MGAIPVSNRAGGVVVAVALLVTLQVLALATGHMPTQRERVAGPPKPCTAKAPCCPYTGTTQFCRVGCSAPTPAVPLSRPGPDIKSLQQPLPTGIAILELGIDERGQVLWACVLHGLRTDFDEAAQRAALKWRFRPTLLKGKPVGVVMAVTVDTSGTNTK
jgi:TonB family protein